MVLKKCFSNHTCIKLMCIRFPVIAQNARSVVRQHEKCLGLLWFSLYTAFENLARGRIKFFFWKNKS